MEEAASAADEEQEETYSLFLLFFTAFVTYEILSHWKQKKRQNGSE